jgi:hypothetical protein
VDVFTTSAHGRSFVIAPKYVFMWTPNVGQRDGRVRILERSPSNPLPTRVPFAGGHWVYVAPDRDAEASINLTVNRSVVDLMTPYELAILKDFIDLICLRISTGNREPWGDTDLARALGDHPYHPTTPHPYPDTTRRTPTTLIPTTPVTPIFPTLYAHNSDYDDDIAF